MADFLLTIDERPGREPIPCTVSDIESFLIAVMEERLHGRPIRFVAGHLEPLTGHHPTFLGEPVDLNEAGSLAATGYLHLVRTGISNLLGN